MNILFLDDNPKVCAKYHTDRDCETRLNAYVSLLITRNVHLNKVCDIFKLLDYNQLTNVSGDMFDWVCSDDLHYLWLYRLTANIASENLIRFGTPMFLANSILKAIVPGQINNKDYARAHKGNIIKDAPVHVPTNCEVGGYVVESYRNWYRDGCMLSRAKWTHRNPPKWYTEQFVVGSV